MMNFRQFTSLNYLPFRFLKGQYRLPHGPIPLHNYQKSVNIFSSKFCLLISVQDMNFSIEEHPCACVCFIIIIILQCMHVCFWFGFVLICCSYFRYGCCFYFFVFNPTKCSTYRFVHVVPLNGDIDYGQPSHFL